MNVLMITGDKNFVSSERFRLQASQVEKLVPVYWGRGALWPKIPKEHFDVVTAQDPFWRGHLAGHLSWWLGAKLNLQVHTDLDVQPWLKRAWAGFNLRKAGSVRVVSEKIKKQVERLGVRAPVHMLPIFVDLSPFQNVQHQPHLQKTILWIGRFESEKDPLLALEVFKAVHAQADTKLVMLGAGSLERTLRAAAGNLPVTFPGWHPPASYLAQADAVLCTSKHESWGASIIEALAAGVPVVAPDVGVAREAGAVVVPKKKLAEAVVEVLKNGQRGELKLQLLNAQEWARQWKETLL